MTNKPEDGRPTDREGSAEPTALPIPEEEIDAARSNPAFYVNRIIATNLLNGMRFAFGEQHRPDAPSSFRCSIFMSFEDAIAMRDLIDRQMAMMFAPPMPSTPDGGSADQ